MSWKRKIWGSTLGVVGFLLSPLSWWNDLLVNIPLAIAFAWVVALVYPAAFTPAVLVGYWLTNILGFWLMHKGAQQLLEKDARPYTRRSLLRDLAIASAYTVLILLLVKFQVIQPVTDYFPQR